MRGVFMTPGFIKVEHFVSYDRWPRDVLRWNTLFPMIGDPGMH